MHDIERELIKVTGYKAQRKFSNRQDYLGSILNAAIKLPEDDFENLSNEAADWYNSAIEAKNAKQEILPDFDEINESDGEPDDTDPADTDEGSSDTDSDAGEATSEAAPVASEKPAKIKAPKKSNVVRPPTEEDDVILDKWGCMEGSKNSQALALFEKGATAKEVKAAIGGTYYNMLGKCKAKGHKLEKEGSLIRLTHKSEIGGKPVPKKAKGK